MTPGIKLLDWGGKTSDLCLTERSVEKENEAHLALSTYPDIDVVVFLGGLRPPKNTTYSQFLNRFLVSSKQKHKSEE